MINSKRNTEAMAHSDCFLGVTYKFSYLLTYLLTDTRVGLYYLQSYQATII